MNHNLFLAQDEGCLMGGTRILVAIMCGLFVNCRKTKSIFCSRNCKFNNISKCLQQWINFFVDSVLYHESNKTNMNSCEQNDCSKNGLFGFIYIWYQYS